MREPQGTVSVHSAMEKRQLLLIDDDRLQFRITQSLVRGFRPPYELDWASTYEEGVERLLSRPYAACLLDFQLGPRDGLGGINVRIVRRRAGDCRRRPRR